MIDTQKETPEAWVGCLACYNDGRLVGAWMDGTEADDRDKFEELVGDIGDGTDPDGHSLAHEELWVMDFQGYGGFLDGECSPMEAQRIAEALEAVPDHIDLTALAAYRANIGPAYFNLDDLDGFEDAYLGEWASEAEYAEDYAESGGLISEDASWPYTYIDWDRAADELELWTADAGGGRVHVFSQR